MAELLRDNWKYFIGALLIHGAIAVMLLVTANFTSPSTPPPQLAIKAVVVDQSVLRQLSRERDRQADAQKQADAAEREQKRQQEEIEKQRRQEELERQREQQAQRETEQLKQQQAERQREIDRQKQAQLEAEAKQRQAAEEQRKQQALAEQKRVAEIQQKQREAEQRRQAEDAKAQAAREAELKAQLAAEEGQMQAANSGLESQYVAMIQQKVMRNWSKPDSAKPGLSCEVKVAQTTNGTVLSAEVAKCNGDAAVKQSIVAAVLSSSPLPAAPDPRVFQRNLVFKFEPKE